MSAFAYNCERETEAQQICERIAAAIQAKGVDYGWGKIYIVEEGVISEADADSWSKILTKRFMEMRATYPPHTKHGVKWVDAATYATVRIWSPGNSGIES